MGDFGVIDGQPFQWDDPDATSNFSLAQFRTLSGGGEIDQQQSPNPDAVALTDSRTGPEDSMAAAMRLAPREKSLGLGAAVGAAIIIGNVAMAPAAAGLGAVGVAGMAGTIAIGWVALAVLPQSQGSLEAEAMIEIKMDEAVTEWENTHSITVEDYIQKMLAAPVEPPTPSPPPNWAPHKFFEKRKERSYRYAYMFPLFLLIFILFRRRRKRK